jgi:hypothetical protein
MHTRALAAAAHAGNLPPSCGLGEDGQRTTHARPLRRDCNHSPLRRAKADGAAPVTVELCRFVAGELKRRDRHCHNVVEQGHLSIDATQVGQFTAPPIRDRFSNGLRRNLIRRTLKLESLILGHLSAKPHSDDCGAPALGGRRRLRSCAQVAILDRVQ